MKKFIKWLVSLFRHKKSSKTITVHETMQEIVKTILNDKNRLKKERVEIFKTIYKKDDRGKLFPLRKSKSVNIYYKDKDQRALEIRRKTILYERNEL